MPTDGTIIDYPGTYGGPGSREEVLRVLKEALALLENTAAHAEVCCAGLRIEVLPGGIPPEEL